MPRAEHRLANSPYVKQQAAAFRRAVKGYREKKSLTFAEASKQFGITIPHLYNIEAGISFPSFSVYVTICKKMGLEPLPIFEKA